MGAPDVVEIASVNVAEPAVLLRYEGQDIFSSIDKRPVTSPTLELTQVNLEGDRQADTRPTAAGGQIHGGVHQAVYAFPSEHYPRVSALVDGETWPGYMGENLTTIGATERDVCIGDVWQWGSATLQVSAPRAPCYKLGIRMGKQAARTVIREEVLTGWYLRVLEPGTVPTTGTIRIVGRHPDAVTVEAVQRAVQDRGTVHPDLARLEVLSPSVRAILSFRDRDIFGGVPESD